MKGECVGGGILLAAGEPKNEDNHKYQAYAPNGIKAPIFTVGPNRQATDEGNDDNDGEYQH